MPQPAFGHWFQFTLTRALGSSFRPLGLGSTRPSCPRISTRIFTVEPRIGCCCPRRGPVLSTKTIFRTTRTVRRTRTVRPRLQLDVGNLAVSAGQARSWAEPETASEAQSEASESRALLGSFGRIDCVTCPKGVKPLKLIKNNASPKNVQYCCAPRRTILSTKTLRIKTITRVKVVTVTPRPAKVGFLIRDRFVSHRD
jgi:hypothetical protein